MNKKKILNTFYWILLASIIIFVAYVKGWILADFDSITPTQAHAMLQRDDNVALLDVRTDEEYHQEHIEGTLHIPLQSLRENISKLSGEKNKKIIVYCHSGNRSVSASRILLENGFHPLNLNGGISQWKSEGLGVTD